MNFGKSIRIIRAKKGVSQQDFAIFTGIDPSLISRIESGERKPSKNNLNAISRKFDIPIELIKLLALEKKDLRELKPEEVESISSNLLGLLVG